MPQTKKKRRPILLVSVASLAAVTVGYLEFYAPPIIDPPEFFSDGEVQIQYLVARSPFSRRVVSRLVTVDRLWRRPSRYEFRGRDVLVDSANVQPADCVILADDDLHVGSPETFELLWNQRGYVTHLREANRVDDALKPFLNQVAEETGDLHLARLSWVRIYKMD